MATTYALARVAERYGRQLGVLDQPRAGEVQQAPVPRTGGYAMLGGLWLALFIGYLTREWFLVDPATGPMWNPADDQRILGLVLGSVCIVPLAILDDRRRLGPWPQLAGQIAIAAIPVAFGLRVSSIAHPFGDPLQLPLWLDVPDQHPVVRGHDERHQLGGCHGRPGGRRGVRGGNRAVRARVPLSPVFDCALPAGRGRACASGSWAAIGRRRRIFMGSSGSLLLGFALAGSGILGGAKVGTALLVLGVPILDAAWVIFRRLTRGARPTIGGDREHLPMKLHDLGLSTGQTVLVLYFVSAVLGIVGLSMHTPPEAPSFDKLYALLGMVLVVLVVLAGVTVAVTRRRRA